MEIIRFGSPMPWKHVVHTVQDNRVQRDRERPHPASFPPRLAEMCVKLHGSSKVETVMDPFMGLGNTAVACVHLGKSCLGYEIDPEYWKVSCEQVSRALEREDAE